MPSLSKIAIAAAAFAAPSLAATGKSTRYWDCCKPSCAWPGKAAVSAPITTCGKNDQPLSDANAQSGCNGGSSYTCSNYSPWKVSDSVAYGFAATNLSGGSEASWCCACYQLTFTSTAVQGKTMIVQSTNTGGDLGENHFDILMPGGGVGLFDGCSPQWGSFPGAQYGGVSSRSECDSMPAALKAGCQWRFDWFQNADNPALSWERVQCPKALTDVSGCKRDDDASYPAPKGGDASPAPAASDKASSSSSSSSSSTAAAATSASSSDAQQTQTQTQQQPTSSVPDDKKPVNSSPASSAAAPTVSKGPSKCKSKKAKRHLNQHIHH